MIVVQRILFLFLLFCSFVRILNGCRQSIFFAFSHFNRFHSLFFSVTDTPSVSRILPLVHPSNLQITSRGRVVFNALPSTQMDSFGDVTSYISFLSPEYLNSVGKKLTFVESDVEKVREKCSIVLLVSFVSQTNDLIESKKKILHGKRLSFFFRSLNVILNQSFEIATTFPSIYHLRACNCVGNAFSMVTRSAYGQFR